MPRLPTLDDYDRMLSDVDDPDQEEYLDFPYSVQDNPLDAFDRVVELAVVYGKELAEELVLDLQINSAEEALTVHWGILEPRVDTVVDNLTASFKEEFPGLSKKERAQIDFASIKSSVILGLLEEIEADLAAKK